MRPVELDFAAAVRLNSTWTAAFVLVRWSGNRPLGVNAGAQTYPKKRLKSR
jgi:hypothetical protein